MPISSPSLLRADLPWSCESGLLGDTAAPRVRCHSRRAAVQNPPLAYPHGSRIIATIRNLAARQIYGSDTLPPFHQGCADLNSAGVDVINKRLVEDGFAEGYRHDVFYQLNWDIGVRNRDEIILLGNELNENHEAMVRLFKSVQEN